MPATSRTAADDETVPCSHRDCNLSLFDEHYKSRIRREFRALSLEQRQLVLSTTTLRLCVFPDGACEFPFVIDCFLPWNGSLLSVCHEFYCHALKISQRMLEQHHESEWNAAKKKAFAASSYFSSSRLRRTQNAYAQNLSSVIESFNVLPVDASNYTPRGAADKSISAKRYSKKQKQRRPKLSARAYPKLKTSTATSSSKLSAKAKSKANSKCKDDATDEPKLLLGLLRIAGNSKRSDAEKGEPVAKTKKKKKETAPENSKEDLLQPLNRFMSRVRSIAGRVDGIASEFHREEMAESDAMRDHLYLGRVLSEADVDPSAGDAIDGGAHWKRVQRMFSVMDAKEAEHRGKHHIETAIKNMKARQLRELLTTVKGSLAQMHQSVADTETEFEVDDTEADAEALSEFDRFIAPALRCAKPNTKAQSKTSVLIGNKKGVLKSLDNIAALHKNMKSLTTTVTSTMNSQPGNPADHLNTTEVILQTPEDMKSKSKRRAVHFAASVPEDAPSDGFVEDMLLSKIEDLRAEADEWKSKYLALTVDHRRISVQHAKQGQIARALQIAKHELMLEPTATEHTQSEPAHEQQYTSETMDAAVQTGDVEVDDEAQDNKSRPKSILEAVAHVDRAPM